MSRAEITHNTSDMSLQVCHCGWSKVTSYHGLRTHQGKMGCTPRGTRIPENEQYLCRNDILQTKQYDTWLDISLIKTEIDRTDSSLNESLQVCHCGWSKETSYHGLRIHQGKMGCTPLGMRIPENEQYLWRRQGENDRRWNTLQGNSTLVKKERVLLPPNTDVQTTPPAPVAPVAPPVAPTPPSARITDQTTAWSGLDHISYISFQNAAHAEAVRRRLDFTTDVQYTPRSLIWEVLTTTHQERAVLPRETDRGRSRPPQPSQERIKVNLQQKVQMREQKVDEIRASVKACKVSLDREWLEINGVFSELLEALEDVRRKALQPLEERRQRAKREAKELIQELQREIHQLKNTIAELEKDSAIQVSPTLTNLDDSREWRKVTFDTSLSFGTLRTTTSTMMEQMQEKLEKLSAIELARIPTFAVNLKLDPTTAHARLIMSEDGKEVRDGGQIQEVPDAPERFDLFGSVLGLNKLSSGKSYWEVEVSNKTGWDLGVATGNANRKGKLSLNPNSGYWIVVHYEDKEYAAMRDPPIRLSLKEKPQTVGVFVDYEEGLVSFYDVKDSSHIYSFTGCSFTEELSPYLSPHFKQDGNTSDPLIIL
ncbi:uncharacterized protein ACJ7VT_012710 isoform 2-T2 [Polymixia lowei]